MTVDRGGMEYRISVEDGFSAGLSGFVDGAKSARDAWRSLRGELAKPLRVPESGVEGAARGTSEAAKARKEASDARREEAKAARDAAKRKRAELALAALTEREQNSIGKRAAKEREELVDRGIEVTQREKDKRVAAASKAASEELAIEQRIETAFRAVQKRLDADDKRYNDERLRREREFVEAKIRTSNALLAQRNREERTNDKAFDSAVEQRIRTESSLLKQRRREESEAEKALAAAVERRIKSQGALLQQRIKEEADAEKALAAAVDRRIKSQNALAKQRLAQERAARREQDKAIDKAIAEQNRAGKKLEQQRKAEQRDATRAEKQRLRAIEQEDVRRARELSKALGSSDDAASRLFYTFRRLFGVLAVFQAARVLVNQFKAAVFEVFRFNSRIEDAVLGVQSLLSAVAILSTVQGRTVEGAEKFAAANAEARRQVALLRVEGLKTAATFDELLAAFQTALAPGIRAGLSPDQVRGFAVRIAQAAASIGLPANQLAEEIRSILSGTIQQRTTRIAVALGITNDDIRRAREAGKLADFLVSRFDAFKFSGEAALGNFSTIVSNVKDAVSQVIGTGGRDLFDFVVNGLRRVLNALATTTADGVVLNPRAVELARQFFSIILQAAQEAGRIFEFLTLDRAVEGATRVAQTLRGAVVVAAGFVDGLVTGFRSAFSIASSIAAAVGDAAKAFGFVEGLPIESLRGFAGVLGAAVALVIALRTGFGALALPVRLTVGALRPLSNILVGIVAGSLRLVGAMRAAKGAALLLSAPFLVVAALIGVIVAAFTNDFVRSIEVGGLKIGTLADILKIRLILQVKRLVATFEQLWDAVAAGGKIAFVKVYNLIADIPRRLKKALAGFGELLGFDFSNAIAEAEAQGAALEKQVEAEVEGIRKVARERIAAIDDEIEKEKQAAAEREAALKALDKFGERRTLGEAYEQILAGLRARIALEREATERLNESEAAAVALLDRIAALPPVIGATAEALDKLPEKLREIAEQTADLRNEVDVAARFAGADGFAGKLAEAFASTANEIRKSTFELRSQADIARGAVRGLSEQAKGLTSEILRQSDVTAEGLREITRLGAGLADINSRRVTVESALNGQLREQADALEAGDKLRAEAAARHVTELQREESLLRRQTDTQRDRIAVLLRLYGIETDGTDAVGAAILSLIDVEGRRLDAKRGLAEIVKAQGELESAILDRISKQTRKLAIEETERLRIVNARAAAELDAAKAVDEARRVTAGIDGPLPGVQNETIRALAQARADLVLARQKSDELRREFELRKQILETAISTERNEETRVELQKALNASSEEFAKSLEGGDAAVARIIEEMQRLRFVLDQPLQAGFSSALERFAADARDTFSRWQEIGRTAVEGFADFASETISRALDPTREVDVVERFRLLMQSIVDEVIKAFVRLQIVKSILEPLGLVGGSSDAQIAAASAAAATAVTAATSAAASAALAQAAVAQVAALQAQGAATGGGFSALGFAAGDLVPSVNVAAQRPPGVPKSDTTPAWLTPGEFVHTVDAVRRYGVEAMRAINEGRVDPGALRSLTGVRKASSARNGRRRSIGYAQGDLVRRGRGDAVAALQPNLTIVVVGAREEAIAAMAGKDGQAILVNTARANRKRIFR